jgi:hypothetical protein
LFSELTTVPTFTVPDNHRVGRVRRLALLGFRPVTRTEVPGAGTGDDKIVVRIVMRSAHREVVAAGAVVLACVLTWLGRTTGQPCQ